MECIEVEQPWKSLISSGGAVDADFPWTNSRFVVTGRF
jgi:hypothetical protein